MNKSDSIGALASALAKAQAEIRNPQFDRENQAFKAGGRTSRYASLAAHLEAVRVPLSRNGLAFVQSVETPATGSPSVCVIASLIHTSGEWISSRLTMPAGSTAHAMGSALTYARRYTLAALVGIVGDEDDDGNAATAAAEKPSKAPPKPLPARPGRTG